MGVFTVPERFHPDFNCPSKKPVGPVKLNWDLFNQQYNPRSCALATSAGFFDYYQKKIIPPDSFSNGKFAAGGWENNVNTRISFNFDLGDPDNYGLHHTVLFVGEFVDTGDAFDDLCQFDDNSNRQLGTAYTTGISANGTADGIIVQHGSATVESTSHTATTERKKFAVIIHKDTSTDSGRRYKHYLNIFGVGMFSDDQASNNTFNRDHAYLNIGEASKTNICRVYATATWFGELPDSLMRSLVERPYQLFKPAIPVTFFTAEGGTTTQTITSSLNAILQKQGVTKTAVLDSILQKQGLTVTSSVDALLRKTVTLTADIDGILKKLGVTSTASIEALLQKQGLTLSASLNAILQKAQTISASADAILKKNVSANATLDSILQKQGVTSTASIDAILQAMAIETASLDAILQKQGVTATASLSALLQKTVTLTGVVDAILQKTVTTTASLDAILTSSGTTVFSSIDAILQKTVAVSLSVDALLQKQGLTVYSTIDALLQKSVSATATLDALLLGTISLTASLDSLLKKTGLTITASLDAILSDPVAFVTPKNLIYVMAEDRIASILAEQRTVTVKAENRTVKVIK